MSADSELLAGLVRDPRESLNIEMKAWINIGDVTGQAKLAKACLALRNANGGFLLIGIDDVTRSPCRNGKPANIQAAFHSDVVQGIVTKYASEPFEVTVHFVDCDGDPVVVVEVSSGVRSPVVATRDLGGLEGRLIRENAVYVRTLATNGTVSTAEATRRDWGRLVDLCMDNREADIGRFVRRHLAGLGLTGFSELLAALQPEVPEPTCEERAKSALDAGARRFREVAVERQIDVSATGFWEVGVALCGELPAEAPTLEFLRRLLTANPHHTGWPVWVDSESFRDSESHPFVAEDAWEAFVMPHGKVRGQDITFWRIDTSGSFYHVRTLDDDSARSREHPAPLTAFDFQLALWRTAEAVSVALAMAGAFGLPKETSSLSFLFRWSRLKNRILSSWSDPTRYIEEAEAYQDKIVSQVAVPADTPRSSVFQYVYRATVPLFAAFRGTHLDPSVVEGICARALGLRR